MTARRPIGMSAAEWFWSRISVNPINQCWEWTGPRDKYGYGHHSFSGKNWLSHRWSYIEKVGPIPDGMCLDHLCRNHACVNPDHLEPVTRGENNLRGFGPAAMKARMTSCERGHEFTPENTYMRRDRPGHRMCRTCMSARAKSRVRVARGAR